MHGVRRGAFALLPVFAAAIALSRTSPPAVVQLPPGLVELHREITVEGGTELRGAATGTTLRMSADFQGRAAIVVAGDHVIVSDLAIRGNRETATTRAGLPPSDVPFVRFTSANGILAAGISDLRVTRVRFEEIAGFAVLISNVKDAGLDHLAIANSGSRNAAGRNNTTGGILLEEGSSGFRVADCVFNAVTGNAVWTHSLYTSPRNREGRLERNRFHEIGRDAIQVGHAVDVRVTENSGDRIGFPVDVVDMDNLGVPVAIDTAGNVERALYSANHFEEINGKCIDLDGFHDGIVQGNTCVNRLPPERYPYGSYGIVMNNSNPDMESRNIVIDGNRIEGALFGGIFIIGSGHRVTRNRLVHLNTAHCNEEAARFGCYFAAGEPDMLRSGIYLGKGAHRPDRARDNVIDANEISGFGMQSHCIVFAPGVDQAANTLRGNVCRDLP